VNPRKIPHKDAFDRLPTNIQQTLIVSGSVMRRLLKKKLEQQAEEEAEIEELMEPEEVLDADD
jgi:hypothetical protein